MITEKEVQLIRQRMIALGDYEGLREFDELRQQAEAILSRHSEEERRAIEAYLREERNQIQKN
jgi:hypothetical protein